MNANICNHEGCTCKAGENGYCSDYCASHGDDDRADAAPHACGCGHAECDHAATAE